MNSESEFLSVLAKCGLVSADEIAAALLRFEEAGIQDERDSMTLIDFFVLDGLLTPWQCEKICQGKHRGFFVDDFVFLAHIQAKDTVTSYLASDRMDDSTVVLEVAMSKGAPGGFRYRVTLRRKATRGTWSVVSEHDSG